MTEESIDFWGRFLTLQESVETVLMKDHFHLYQQIQMEWLKRERKRKSYKGDNHGASQSSEYVR